MVIPGVPHHVTQRGVRRMETFFDNEDYEDYEDYEAYMTLMAEWCSLSGLEVWAYCLMPNHVHLIVVPDKEESLAKGIGEAHRRYTRHINFKNRWKGYLWQGRFASFPMDESYLLAAARYIELNPVRAKMVARAQDYRWSSATAHLNGVDDGLVKVQPILQRTSSWTEILASGEEAIFDDIRQHERTGRPLGSEGFVKKVSALVGRDLRKKRPGPKRRRDN